jgi:cysteinyl-tRNA synthetase
MTLRLTNSLTHKLESFIPLDGNTVKIYCCGVTVYDLCHIGHARSYIVWDVLRRYLIWNGYDVTFVQNITDIDDKIINRASQESTSVDNIVGKNIQEYHRDMDALNIMPPDHMPRVTKSLDSIRLMISELEAQGRAYSLDGDVYFSVMMFSNYGKLSNRDIHSQLSNGIEDKNNPYDFALWKKSKSGEPSYSSPWGWGRPGWHIECSAMIRQELGDQIDIHLGGSDLIFPHHENEIAQSESITGKSLAKYWLHNGMVTVNNQKMSKSLGNFTTIRELLDSNVNPMAIRLFVLQANYRKPLNFTKESIDAASSAWNKIQSAINVGYCHNWTPSTLPDNDFVIRFINAMNDDLNTSVVLSIIFELIEPLLSISNENELMNQEYRWRTLINILLILGFKVENTHKNSSDYDAPYIEELIAKRQTARSTKNFSIADVIRSDLMSHGIELFDKSDGTTSWSYIQ